MSLWFVLKVNDGAIGSLTIRRLRGQLSPERHRSPFPDTIFEYSVTKDGREIGTVDHRYGDGPWRLVRRALDLIALSEPADAVAPLLGLARNDSAADRVEAGLPGQDPGDGGVDLPR